VPKIDGLLERTCVSALVNPRPAIIPPAGTYARARARKTAEIDPPHPFIKLIKFNNSPHPPALVEIDHMFYIMEYKIIYRYMFICLVSGGMNPVVDRQNGLLPVVETCLCVFTK
jgi:hypothetical protein